MNIQVLVVSFDSKSFARQYAQETHLKWPLLLNHDLSLYHAYDMVRGSWWSIYNPLSIARYLALMIRGKKPGKPGKDWRQLGGDVLIDPDRIVRLHHVSEHPHDRPSVDSILTIKDQFSDSQPNSKAPDPSR